MSLPTTLDHLRDDRIVKLAAYWLARRGTGLVPQRRDIDPLDIPWALPFIWLCDYLPEERDFRYRLAGEAVNEAFGRNLGGRRFREVASPDRYPGVRGRYLGVVDGPAIAHSIGAIYLNIDRPVAGERIVLPLSSGSLSSGLLSGAPVSDDGGRIDMILGLTVYERGTIHPGHKAPDTALRTTFTPLSDL